MKRVGLGLAAAVSLLGLGIGPAGAADDVDTEMIVAGRPVPEGKYVFQVRLYDSGDDSVGFCGGSIIDKHWVLTAAHCIIEPVLDEEGVVVGYGSIDRAATSKREADKMFVHPDYLACDEDVPCRNAAKADIALIRLKEPILDTRPIVLAGADDDMSLLTPGTKVTVTGWGAIWDPEDEDVVGLLSQFLSPQDVRDRINFPRKLHEVDVQVMANEECKAVFGGTDIADREICAMQPGTAKDSCYGDSGGPLIVPAGNPSGFVQVGVVSWGRKCGTRVYPGVYARVSAFSDWLEQTMADNAPSEPDTPVAVDAPGSKPKPPVSVEVIVTKPKPPASDVGSGARQDAE